MSIFAQGVFYGEYDLPATNQRVPPEIAITPTGLQLTLVLQTIFDHSIETRVLNQHEDATWACGHSLLLGMTRQSLFITTEIQQCFKSPDNFPSSDN